MIRTDYKFLSWFKHCIWRHNIKTHEVQNDGNYLYESNQETDTRDNNTLQM